MENPVDWYPWGTEALEKSRLEDKPIFLSIGYAACHWCHVMAHESFEDPDTAAVMNEHFVNIKVDREERPDLDSIYMSAVVAMTGQGGWPMSVFLTPDQQPFYGGTYFPPVSRYNIPAFRDVLLSVAKTWRGDRAGILDSSVKISDYLKSNQSVPEHTSELKMENLEGAYSTLSSSYDWQHGGWGSAPKFPQSMAIEFLLRRASRGDEGSLKIATHALDAMAQGGLYDLIGGGFARYSTDNDWLVPHFEKMLYDNALLARAYLHAYLITGEQRYRQVCTQTLDFVMREMTHPDGGFYSSLDADSEGHEGKFYVWTEEEIQDEISDPEDVDFILSAFSFRGAPNFEGKFIPRRVMDDAQLAENFSMTTEKVSINLDRVSQDLLALRSKRVRPGTDDKVLVAWNAWMCVAYSEVGRYLDIADYKDMATRNLNFLISKMFPGGKLHRSWREGSLGGTAFLDDYASLVLALLVHYQTDPDPRWFEEAMGLSKSMQKQFSSNEDLYFDTPVEHEDLLVRPRDIQDNATPSGNALAAHALLQLSAYQGDSALKSEAEKMLSRMQLLAAKHPSGFGYWLCALDFAMNDIHEVAVIGDWNDDRTGKLASALWSRYRPGMVAAISPPSFGLPHPALLNQRTQLDDAPTAYVCQGFVCQQPVTDPEAMLKLLDT
jgi:uncharacterized protein YyaL (SSP411 family)